MLLLELDGELATADVDMGPAGRPPLVQPGVDADDFPDRSLARIGIRTRREPHPQRVAEVLLQGRVVSLRCGVDQGLKVSGSSGSETTKLPDRKPRRCLTLCVVRVRSGAPGPMPSSMSPTCMSWMWGSMISIVWC